MSTLCGTPSSLLSNEIVMVSFAGAARQSVENREFSAEMETDDREGRHVAWCCGPPPPHATRPNETRTRTSNLRIDGFLQPNADAPEPTGPGLGPLRTMPGWP